MNRRHFIRSTAAGALASTLIPRITTGQPQAAPRPNILYLWTDQQSAAAMSNAGNPWLSTPAMDRLAREGVTFDRAYCTNPICVPSRTSWITGRMPHETTVTYNTRQHPIGAVPLSPQLRHDGYTMGHGMVLTMSRTLHPKALIPPCLRLAKNFCARSTNSHSSSWPHWSIPMTYANGRAG
jgi:hypothetical protein